MRIEAPALDRDALLALLDQALRAEAVTDAPPAVERGDWLYGSAGYGEPVSDEQVNDFSLLLAPDQRLSRQCGGV